MQETKNEANKVLALLMDGTLAKDTVYKAKMTELDTTITAKQDELGQCEAQRRVAQMSATSAEFLHSNIRFAMKYFDQAPADAQKQLLKLLIKSVTFLDDKVELRLYIDTPLDKMKFNFPPSTGKTPVNTKDPADPAMIAPSKAETSDQNNGALTPDGDCLSQRPTWLPIMDAGQTIFQPKRDMALLIDFYKIRSKSIRMSLGVPLKEHQARPNFVKALAATK